MTKQSKSDQTRQKILTTGRQLVTKGGFNAVGLSLILNASGVPKGSFYHYFPSKEAFGEALLQDYVAEYRTRLDALMKMDGTAAEKLMTFCAAWLDQERQAGLVSTCLVVKLGAEVADLSESMRKVLDNGVKVLIAMLADLLWEGAHDGSLLPQDDPDAVAETLYAEWLGAAILSKLAADQRPLERALINTQARLIADAHKGENQ
ncbi:TetR/AcrR family transcriptional regulator [Martelella mediterranea]|uniref:HTH-type transcriptional repressor NemR n=1 Tax=Martelella mediterranea DSM 17316 TaxID=1122214 RepID=A0A1U9YZZ6_9HYPH|nr:TetR/AcrR family transcriptional regulator [Martelella mediterranea]AQZ51004.1 HTH-type transcriptional repressor NemR [Martelella mediterranea DSM 17316]